LAISVPLSLQGELTAPSCTLDSLDLLIEGPAAGIDFYVDDVALIAAE
jgi:hypothetical protein